MYSIIRKLLIVSAVLHFSISCQAESRPLVINEDADRPSLHVSFDDCASFGDGSNADYSEFTATATANAICSNLSLVGGHVYRDSSSVNKHSCTEGLDDTPAMCISAFSGCTYDINNNKALRFDVQVIPGPDGLGSLEEISFFSQAPEQFNYLDGPMGPNNYPEFFALRIFTDTEELILIEDIPTSRTWLERVYNFENMPEFLVEDTTVFHVSILPYCPTGNGADVMAWDIDELYITGGCHNIRAGFISGNVPSELCTDIDDPGTFEFTVSDEVGDNTGWLLVDSDNNIIVLQDTGVFDFSNYPTGSYTVLHIAYEDDTQNLAAGNNLADISGCFDLSNSISFSNQVVQGGNLLTGGSFMAEVCTATGQDAEVIVDLSDATGTGLLYILTDSVNVILDFQTGDTFDFTGSPSGTCLIYAMSFEGQVMNFTPGNNITDITGCYALSSPVGIFRTYVDGGELLASDGNTELSICNGQDSLLIDLLVQNTEGDSSHIFITDENDEIVALPAGAAADFTGFTAGTYSIYNITWSGTITGLETGSMTPDIAGCFSISNPVTVEIIEVDGGSLSDDSGAMMAGFCIDDPGNSTLILSLQAAIGDSMQFVITDSLDDIILITDSDTLDVSVFSEGVYEVYNISFAPGLMNLTVFANISDLEGCFDLSNPVTFTITDLEGGSLVFEDGSTEADICSGDGIPDPLTVQVSGANGPHSLLLITDINGLVLDMSTADIIDLEGAGAGTCLIYNIVYTDSLTIAGDSLNINELQGCFELSNALEVNRSEVNGGNLMTTDSLTSVIIIVGDGLPDSIDLVLENSVGDSMSWVITDATGVIVALPDTFPIDFESQDTGICVIYNIAFNGPLSGLIEGTSIDSIAGCFALSNPVTLERTMLSGGNLMTADSLTMVSICAGDGFADPIDVILEDADGSFSTWIVTDTAGLILALPAGPPFDLESAGNGICLIWHLSYENNLTGLDVGNNINQLTGSYDLSNEISVDRTGVAGGTLMTTDSLTSVMVCSGDGLPNMVDLVLTNNEGDSSVWVVTDTALTILDLPAALPIEFEGIAEGICLIWNLSYSDSINGLDIGNNVVDLSGCFDLSNPVEIIREEINGGELETTMGTDTVMIIAGDGVPDAFDVVLNDTIGNFSAWVITNADDLIIALPPGPPFDLENAGGGVCRIWHLSYNQDQMLSFGMGLDQVTGCHEFSNPITVIRTGLNGGMLMAADGSTTVDVCIADGVSDPVDVILTDTIGSESSWAITDTSGLILGVPSGPPFDFTGAGQGICQVWHISHESGLTGLEVDSLLGDLQGVFHLSNPLEVIRSQVDGGSIMTTDSLTEVTLMVGDGMPDIVQAVVENESGDSTAWIVTDTSGLILDINTTGIFDFDGAGSGICLVYHISYSTPLAGLEPGGQAADMVGCFDLSNEITIIRQGLNGGIFTTSNFMTAVDLCVGDGVSEPINTILSDTIGAFFQYLITDTTGLILGLPAGPPFDLEGSGPGVCQIWHMAYESGLTGDTLGGNITSLEGDFDLSNAITVTREQVSGGMIITGDSMTNVTIVVGEGINDTIDVLLAGESGDSSVWIISDTLGQILALPQNPPFLFEDAGPGVCLIWHLSYNSGLTGLAEGNNVDQLTGCFALSNAITVTRTSIDGGFLTDIDGNTTSFICIDDMTTDTVEVILSDAMGVEFDWVITDLSGMILALPTGPPFILDTFTLASCQVYHISSDGSLTGLITGNNLTDLMGGFSLSNALLVEKGTSAGGTLITTDSLTTVMIEVGEGINDTIDVILTGEEGDFGQYIVTDTMGTIMALPPGPPFLFEDAGAGVCELYHLSYSGPITGLMVGGSTGNLEGCLELSNAITIIREGVNGGILTTDTGETETEVCIGDGENDDIQVMLTDTSGMNYAWILTNEDSTILGVPLGPPFNFENAPVLGNTLIWHLAFDSIMPPVDNSLIGQHLDIFSGNFDFSNPLTVIKMEADGGTISTNDPTDIIVGDGIIDTVNVLLEDAVGELMMFLVVNSSGNILDIQTDTLFTFENAGGGNCQIYHISYYPGTTGLFIGNDIDNISGCANLSNPIDISRMTNEAVVISDDNKFEYTMYPQPASEKLFVRFSKMPAHTGKVFLYNRMGQVIHESVLSGPEWHVDLTEFTAGLYYIRFNAGNGDTTDKVLIIR